jgi:hypothetical protein
MAAIFAGTVHDTDRRLQGPAKVAVGTKCPNIPVAGA